MKTIFVIGNGFDLAHNLKTSYNDFLKSLSEETINNNILLKILSKNKNNCWSDIEYTYFTLLNNCEDKNYILQKFGILINELTLGKNGGLKNEFSSEILDNNFNKIKGLLENYLQKEQENLKLIDAYSNLFSTLNDTETLILDFNYTNTIYKYLNGKGSLIEHIKIHGELSSDDNPIIFGYAANEEEAKILSYKNDEYLMKNIKKLRYLLTDNETRLKEMLGMSNNMIDVYVLGHSCGLSDRLILNELFTNKRVNKITPLYYNEQNEFLKTVINIDRVIDDYCIKDKKDKSFNKLNNYKQSTAMIQHNSTKTNIDTFLKFVELIKLNHANKSMIIFNPS